MYPYEIVGEDKVQIQCMTCKTDKTIEVGKQGLHRLLFDDCLIQDAIPNVPKELREMFISGVCPECFTRMFGFPVDE